MAKTRKKILVVDDNPVTQRLYRRILENAGYEVQEAYSGEECLKSVAGSAPDIILMDIILPDIDGKVVVERINNHEKTRGIPVI
ncbi:MAG TPA: hybrid sensor histidine kinase/response regulator, partial [Candidatus Omnitrophica bacterium]|nr:hybrid sensor histidine kinase/response regulator [Candidatus Omnitrophota bacterium]